MKFWNHTENKELHTDEWDKDGMKIMANPAIVCICPTEDCEDYFERIDMMTFHIFCFSLIGIVLGIDQGREIVRKYVTRDEALWLLGWYGLIPSQENNNELKSVIATEESVQHTEKA